MSKVSEVPALLRPIPARDAGARAGEAAAQLLDRVMGQRFAGRLARHGRWTLMRRR